jgi:ketosteroid isomerase-like protein
MSIRLTRCVVAILAVVLASPALGAAQDGPAVNAEAALAAARAAAGRFGRAERSGSLDSIAAAMWPEAVLLPPGRLEVKGHDAIFALLSPGSGPDSTEASKPSPPSGGTVISASGSMAVEWGTGSFMRNGANPQYYKYVTIVEQRAGEWKVLLNTWSPRPAPAPGEASAGEPELAVAEKSPSAKAEAEREAVVAANRRFERVEFLGIMDSIVAAVWDDAVILPPGRRYELKGHEEIFAFLTPGFTPDSAKSFTVRRGSAISPAGDMAALWGPGRWMEQGPDGPIPHYFKAVTIVEKRDGEWKVLLNSWNERAAPEPGAEHGSG